MTTQEALSGIRIYDASQGVAGPHAAMLMALNGADVIKVEPPGAEAEGRAQYIDAAQQFEARGFCTGYGSWRRDVNAIAVPVYALDGKKVYGLNVGGPSFGVKKKQLETVYAPRLIKAAEVIGLRG